MIKVEHLSKKYAAATAVDDISFEIGKHEIVGFLGPNGAGKSTTLKVLTCFHSATSGKVTVDGNDVFEHPEKVKAVIGYLPENVPLYPEMRVREYLDYRAGIKKVPGAKRQEAVTKAIQRCRIDGVQHRIIGQLSKGFRQRVGLADALLADPKILILDEPTVGLDPNQIRDVRELIRELGKERTVILSSHILPEVEAVCSRVIIINRGKIVGQGKPNELRERLNAKKEVVEVEVLDPDHVAESAIQSIDTVEKVTALPVAGVFHVQPNIGKDVRERLFDTAVSAGFKLLAMHTRQSSLEDIFVEIITQEQEDAAQKMGEPEAEEEK
ncbi:MAG: ATP-binding cassette domain-containing protein [Deltaproteobacteria bacterium]|nr:ATP-binding cassette domain-containing protein [Deltaproteobacteria bacterium]MBN2670049.1 ATP-binding cassette domain-containing protein [Deltaproteobacteria bacterium]